MPTYTRHFLPFLTLVLLTAQAQGAYAELLKLTFQGVMTTLSAQASFDPNNLLPFPLPTSTDTVFTMSATVDTGSPDGPTNIPNPTGGPEGTRTRFPVSDITFQAEGQTLRLPNDPTLNQGLDISNDVPVMISPTGDATYADQWTLHGDTQTASDGTYLTVEAFFSGEFGPAPVGPLDSSDFVIPTISDWPIGDIAVILKDANDPNGGAFSPLAILTVSTNSITASPVPVPATAWLLGSALAGLLGFSRKRKTLR